MKITDNEVVNRFNQDTPPFMKKVSRISFWVFVLTTAAVSSIATTGVAVPVWVNFILGMVASASGSLSAGAKLATYEGKTIEETAPDK
jgi:hypothetical protein